MTNSPSNEHGPAAGAGSAPEGGEVPGPARMGRNQRVALAIVGVTLGLVVGIWMALMLNGVMDAGEPAGTTDDLGPDLERLQADVDALALALEESQGQLGENEEALASMVQMVDDVQGQLGQLMADLENAMFLVGQQDGELETLRSELDGTSAQLADTRDLLYEALMQLEYAKGRQDGTQVFVNLTMDELSGVLVELADAIGQMEEAQNALSDAVTQLLKALGGGPPDGYALPSPHLAHYESDLINFACAMCHNANPEGEVSVYDGKLYFNGSLASVDFRVQIDKTNVCSACHDWFPLDEMDPEYRDRNCAQNECHDDWARDMNSPYVNEANVEVSDCLLCHGGQPFYPR